MGRQAWIKLTWRKNLGISVAITLFTLYLSALFNSPTGYAQQTETKYTVVATDNLSERVTSALVRGFDERNSIIFRRNSSATLADLCSGEIHLLATNTPIPNEAFLECPDAIEMLVALDGAVVIVADENDFLTCLSRDHLYEIYRLSETPKRHWYQIDKDFPDRPLSVYIPDLYPMTIQAFNQRIIGRQSPRSEIFYLHDSPANFINTRPSTIGYVPLNVYFDLEYTLRTVALDNGNGACISPSIRTIADGDYLSGERIFWYARSTPESALDNFIQFAFSPNEQSDIIEIGAWLPPENMRRLSLANWYGNISGNRISGDSVPDFEVHLYWEGPYDLDLGLYLPNGTQVSFETMAQAGFYRLADNGNDYCNPIVDTPHETIFALEEMAQPTDYLAFIQLSLRCGAEARAVSYRLEFIVQGKVIKSAMGEVVSHQPPPITIFSYPSATIVE